MKNYIKMIAMLYLLSIPVPFYGIKQLGDIVIGDNEDKTIHRGAIMKLIKDFPTNDKDSTKLAKAKDAIAEFDGDQEDFSDYDTLLKKLKLARSSQDKILAIAAIKGFVNILWHMYSKTKDVTEQNQIYNEIIKFISILAQYDKIAATKMRAMAYVWHNPKKTAVGIAVSTAAIAGAISCYNNPHKCKELIRGNYQSDKDFLNKVLEDRKTELEKQGASPEKIKEELAIIRTQYARGLGLVISLDHFHSNISKDVYDPYLKKLRQVKTNSDLYDIEKEMSAQLQKAALKKVDLMKQIEALESQLKHQPDDQEKREKLGKLVHKLRGFTQNFIGLRQFLINLPVRNIYEQNIYAAADFLFQNGSGGGYNNYDLLVPRFNELFSSGTGAYLGGYLPSGYKESFETFFQYKDYRDLVQKIMAS